MLSFLFRLSLLVLFVSLVVARPPRPREPAGRRSGASSGTRRGRRSAPSLAIYIYIYIYMCAYDHHYHHYRYCFIAVAINNNLLVRDAVGLVPRALLS